MSELFAVFNSGSKKASKEDLLSAIVPLLKLLTLTVMGLILANPRTKIIPKATLKLLSKLVFALFLPCLIFTTLGQSITLHNAANWWFIPVNVLISTSIGCFLGYLVALICHPPQEFIRFTIVMTAFGNTGNLPIAIIGSICHTKDNPFGEDCRRKGVAYVSFAQWVAVILVYTLVYHMMEPPLEYYETDDEEGAIEENLFDNCGSRPLLVEAEWPGIEDKKTENAKTPFLATIFRGSSMGFDQPGERYESPSSIGCFQEPRMVRKMRTVAEQTPIQHILQPPTIASLLAIIVGLMPQIRQLFFGDDAPLSFISDSLEILAGAMVPSVMLMLGGMLAEGPNDSRLGIKTTVGIIFARLLVLPLVGMGVVELADKLQILVKDDPMYRFVVLLQYSTPSAILLGAIASLRGYAVSEASALLFWQHICALFSLSFYICVYFKLYL